MAIDVQAAPSTATETPAAPATPAVQPVAPRTVDSLNAAEHTEWRKTGKMPDSKPTNEASATSEESSAAAGEEPDGESAPASEAGKEAQGNKNKRSDAGSRIKELLAENKRLKDAAAAPKTEKPAESSPAAQPEPPKALEEPTEPTLKDFEGKPYEEFETAYRKYVKDLAQYSAKKALADYQQAEVQRKEMDSLNAQVAEAKTRYADYDDVIKPTVAALALDKSVSPAVVQMINSSDVFADLMYALGSKTEDFQKFMSLAKSRPADAIRLVCEMESLVRTEIGKGKAPAKGKETPARNESGQFVPGSEGKPPVKTVTDRGKPPEEVGGRGNAPADEVADAVKREDVRGYIERANARDLAKSK
jgi:hypothetical protein